MSDIFAEATVRISPSLTGFVTDLNAELAKAMKKVKSPVIRVKPGLTRDFVGDLRRQINTAVAQAQKGVKPVIIKTVLQTPSRRALTDLVSAPVSLGAIGHIPPSAGPAGGISAGDQETINRLLKGNVQLLGLQEVAEEKVSRARGRGATATRKQETAEQRLQRIRKSVNDLNKQLTDRIFVEAQATGELGKAKKGLAVTTEVEKKALALRKEAPTAIFSEVRALHELAQAERQVALERVSALEKAAAAGAGPAAPGTTSAQKQAIASARKSADATKVVVAGLRETDEVSKTLGATTKDLTAREELLRKQKILLKDATKASTAAQAVENQVVRTAALEAQKSAQAQVDANSRQITAIKQLQEQERVRSKIIADQTRANARNASAEKRRSEQLSRGGQASLLSLAGIRGATLAASRSFLVGAAAITVFARAVKQFADLERNIDVFRATTSATAEQMEQVRAEATALGADLTLPAVAAGDAAGAMVELAKAGLSVQDSIDGARGVLELSTAAAIDNADAVRLVANVLNAFSLSGKEASEVADTLANAANAAQGSIADIGTAFQQAATAGHQVGLSFQDTATFLTILAKNGIRGSDAGTSLRTALIRLVNPSEKAKKAFEDLGIVLRDARGNIRPDVFLQIASATEALGPAARDATIALIGGQDAFRAVTILGRQSIEAFLDMRAALREEGTAAELAKARTEGLHGAMDGLQSVLETVGTTAAGHVGPALAQFVRTVSSGITAFSENKQVATTLNQTLTATAQTFNLLGDAIQGVAVVALPLAGLLADVATSIGVSNILAGVVAYKALTAVLDGAILRLRILKPLFAVIATARIASAVGEIVRVGDQMVLPFSQAERAALGLQPRLSAVRLAFKGIGQAALAAATGPTALVVALAAVTAAFVFVATRETAAERALRHLREETERLTEATDRLRLARESANAAQRAVTQGRGGIEQAQINLLNAREALREAPGAAGAERRQLLLNLAIATQDVTFATQDYKRSLDELAAAQEESRAAEAAVRKERVKAKEVLDEQFEASKRIGRFAFGSRPQIGAIGAETIARFALVKTIREQAQADSESTNAAVRAASTRERLVALLVEKSKAPLDELQKKLGSIFTAENLDAALRQAAPLFGVKGKEAVEAFIKAVEDGLAGGKSLAGAIRDALKEGDEPAFQAGKDWSRKVSEGFVFGTTEWKDTIGKTASVALGAALRLAVAEAQGASLQAQLAIARDIQANATRKFQQAQANFEKNKTPFTRTNLEKATTAKNQADADVERILGEIESQQSDAQKQVDDAAKKRDTEGQKIVDSLLKGRRATLLQRKITTAALSDWLGDDLKSTKAWLEFLKKQKVILLARLKAVGASQQLIKETMQAISDLIFQTTNDLKKVNQDIEDKAKERSEALQSILFQKIDLRIQIAQTREDIALEIKLRRQKLALITKELVRLKKTVGTNTVAWLELKLAQQEEIAAIKELQGQIKDRNNAFASLSFDFLQMQSGFAANLLGNLIPMGATGGLVSNGGGPTSFGGGGPTGGGGGGIIGGLGDLPGIGSIPTKIPGGGVTKDLDQTTKIGAATGGPTRGGQTNTNHLLQQILRVLLAINRGDGHPEAHHRRGQQRTETSYLEQHH